MGVTLLRCDVSFSCGLQDPSAAVRQQAVDLLGGSMGQDASLASAYFDTIVQFSADTSTSVRKVRPSSANLLGRGSCSHAGPPEACTWPLQASAATVHSLAALYAT